MGNLHYYYNVKYLEEIASKKNDSLNRSLIKAINSNDVLEESKRLAKRLQNTNLFSSFKLKTTYPGLLFGSGYPHMSGEKVDGELQVGFNFDYTSGVPYYPGSSLKGVISHILKKAQNYTELKEFVCGGTDNINLDKLLQEDVFVGAYIVGLCKPNNRLMDIDYITPHLELKKPDDEQKRTDDEQKKLNELINPNPIPFIRINPNVVLEFFFIINIDEEDISEDDKEKARNERLEIYKRIIMEFGIGAKTNVGYGRMTTYDESKFKDEIAEYKPSNNSNSKKNKNNGGKNHQNNSKKKDSYYK